MPAGQLRRPGTCHTPPPMHLPTSHGPGHIGNMQRARALGGEWQADPARIQPLPPCSCGLCSRGTSCWLGPSSPRRNLGIGAAATLPAIRISDPVLTTGEKPPSSLSGCVQGPGGGAPIITPTPPRPSGSSCRACSHGLLLGQRCSHQHQAPLCKV